METAKIFENGRSQAVRLPKKFRFNTDEVIVQQLGDAVILVPRVAGIRASNRSVKICDLYAGHKYLHLRNEKQTRTRIAAAEERIE